MAEANDANNTVQDDGIGVSSSPDAPRYDPEGQNVLGTIENLDEGPEESSAETLKTDGTGEEKDKAAGEGKVAGQEDKPKPYHLDPDWQRMISERDQAKREAEAAKAEIEKVRGERQAQAEPKGDELPPYKGPAYKDITQLTKEQIAEWREEDEVGFQANVLAQQLHEQWVFRQRDLQAEKRQRDQESQQARIRTTFEKYREANPDFEKMWNSGEIPKYMRENPGHNAMSAHQMLTMETRIKAERDKVAKETEAKVLANVKAKRSATVLGAGPGTSGAPAADKELSDTKSSGGLTSVLAQRLQRLRKAG